MDVNVVDNLVAEAPVIALVGPPMEGMKIQVLQEHLAKALADASKAIASRSTLPILSNLLLETVGDSQLRVSANNFEIAIDRFVPCKVEAPGSITLPAKLLTNFVGMLPPERIEIEVDCGTMSAELRCGRTNSRINGIDPAEFPEAKITSDVVSILEVPSEALKQAIKLVGFAASKEESRPTFTGISFNVLADSITFVAADGFRLSKKSLNTGHEQAQKLLVPALSLQKLVQIIGESEQTIKIMAAERMISFAGDDFKLTAQLIDGDYPDYTRIIPKNHATTVTVETRLFDEAVKLINLFAKDSANIVILKIEPPTEEGQAFGRVTLLGDSAELGGAVSVLDAAVEGDPVEIAFNTLYLHDVLSNVNAPTVQLKLGASDKPGVVTIPGEDDFIHVIMPMALPNRLTEN